MKQDFTLEDILEEQRLEREKSRTAGESAPAARPEYEAELPAQPAPQPPTDVPEYTGEPSYEEPPEAFSPAPPEQEPPEPEEGEKSKKKKKKRWGLFNWRKKVPDFDENEDDMYYGIQLKPLDEYRMDGDAPPLGEEGYQALFDDSKAIDDQVEENFQLLQKERRRRVAEAVQSAGLDEQQVAEEFGVAAPMPVSSFAADPYARQHGLEVEGGQAADELQQAMLQTSSETMEIKLNVLNSTIELQKVRDGQPVSEETVDRILASVPLEPQPPVYQETPPPAGEPDQGPVYVEAPQAGLPQPPVYQEAPPPAGEPGQAPVYVEAPQAGLPQPPVYQETPPPAGEPDQGPVYVEAPQADQPQPPVYQEAPPPAGKPGQAPVYVEAPQADQPQPAQEKTVVIPVVERDSRPEAPKPLPKAPPPRPVQEVPYVESIFQYRSRNLPTHIINADVLQTALLAESEALERMKEAEELKKAPRKRPAPPRPKKPEEPQPAPLSPEERQEALEDYTGPDDARSVSNELRGEMREISMRMMICGVCTVLLALVSLVCRSRFSIENGSGSWPLAYVILNLVFLTVSIGISYKTVLSGLKALFTAKANADSPVAAAALAAVVQTLCAVFFQNELVAGGLHLYAAVVSALLLANAAGKLTMMRRIHSNFRFVTSREQKYAVRVFDDYNTSLKMTKDCVAEKPLIAFQSKAGFLRRFLELSYEPDPSESSSQMLAPLGLVSSLALCVACLLITRSVPAAISAFAAASCACVAAGNMLTINLPVSRMCKTARRAGGMAVGYEAVERFGDVNAVISDAGELFPTGTVVLGGIKTFGSKSVAEQAIMAASALMREVGGPLSGVFQQVISENEEGLPEVEKFTYESGGGVVGRVDGRTIYIGVRGLLINHRLEVPTREEETQYASGNRNIIYIAVDAAVVAMLVLNYTADRRKKNELQRLEDSGISVLVRSTDPNVTAGMLSRLFGVDPASVGILDAQLGDTAQRLMEDIQPRSDAAAATKGRMESMMSLISACVDLKRISGVLVTFQTAAVILTFVLVAFLSCFGHIKQLSALLLFLVHLAWVGLLTLIPRFRN